MAASKSTSRPKRSSKFQPGNTVRRDYVLANPKPSPLVGLEFGKSGTTITHGYISSSNFNPDLTGTRGIEVFDQMRRGCAVVRAALQAMKQPILQANWYVEPASEDPKDKEIAAFVEKNLFNMSITWQDFLRHALLNLDYGRMVFEKVYEYREDGKIWLKKLAPRLPSTIWQWELTDGRPGIVQQLPDGSRPEIPIEKLLIIVNEKEGDDWEGHSMLEAAHANWYYLTSLYKIDAMAHERHGLGIAYGKLPKGTRATEYNKADELLKNVRANQSSRLLWEGNETEFGFIDMKSGTLKSPTDSIREHTMQIMLSMLANHLLLGQNGTGSFALSKDRSDFFNLVLQAIAKNMFDSINNYCVKQLVDFNYFVDEYPRLNVTKIINVNFNELMQGLNLGVQTSLFHPTEKDEQRVRELVDMPASTEASPAVDEQAIEKTPEEKVETVASEHALSGQTLMLAQQRTNLEDTLLRTSKLLDALEHDQN